MRYLAVFLCLIGSGISAGANEHGAVSKHIALAKTVVEICGRLMPNNPEVEKEILRLGFVTDRWNGRFHVMQNPSAPVSVVVTGPDTYDKHCAILVEDMTLDQGRDLVQSWLVATDAGSVERGSSKAAYVWSGLKEGFIARIAVFEKSHDERIEGAWVRLIIADKPI